MGIEVVILESLGWSVAEDGVEIGGVVAGEGEPPIAPERMVSFERAHTLKQTGIARGNTLGV